MAQLPEKKTLPMMTAVIAMVILVIGGLGIGILAGRTILAAPPPVQAPQGLQGEQKVGALLPLTGSLSSFGANSRDMIRFARDDVNSYLRNAGANWTISLVEEDSGTDGPTALQKLTSMAATGVRFVVGPQASSEVRTIASFANTQKIILISQSSTAPDLRIPGDYVFRFAPDDTAQGPAVAATVLARGVDYVVQMYRGDAWGDGLSPTASNAYTAKGGVVNSTIRFDPASADVGTVQTFVATLNAKISALLQDHPAADVGVMLIAFEEAEFILADANNYPNLRAVRWFGSDGTAQSARIIANTVGRQVAEQVDFINTIFAPTTSSKFNSLTQRLGRTAEVYAYAAYDAVWVIALGLQAVNEYDSEAVRAILPTVAQNFFGSTGWITLNDGGDRSIADYDLWEVTVSGTTYSWTLMGTYLSATDAVRFN